MDEYQQRRLARQAWLDGLKPGDKFAMELSRGYKGHEYMIGTIKHITPKRNRFDIEFDRGWGVKSVNSDGYETGGKGSFHLRRHIEPITQEKTDHNRRLDLQERLEKLVHGKDGLGIRDDLTTDQVERIISILEEAHGQVEKKPT